MHHDLTSYSSHELVGPAILKSFDIKKQKSTSAAVELFVFFSLKYFKNLNTKYFLKIITIRVMLP